MFEAHFMSQYPERIFFLIDGVVLKAMGIYPPLLPQYLQDSLQFSLPTFNELLMNFYEQDLADGCKFPCIIDVSGGGNILLLEFLD